MSLRTALEAFSALFGPLPGVRALTGPPEAVMDATFAVNWVLGYWGQLRCGAADGNKELPVRTTCHRTGPWHPRVMKPRVVG